MSNKFLSVVLSLSLLSSYSCVHAMLPMADMMGEFMDKMRDIKTVADAMQAIDKVKDAESIVKGLKDSVSKAPTSHLATLGSLTGIGYTGYRFISSLLSTKDDLTYVAQVVEYGIDKVDETINIKKEDIVVKAKLEAREEFEREFGEKLEEEKSFMQAKIDEIKMISFNLLRLKQEKINEQTQMINDLTKALATTKPVTPPWVQTSQSSNGNEGYIEFEASDL